MRNDELLMRMLSQMESSGRRNMKHDPNGLSDSQKKIHGDVTGMGEFGMMPRTVYDLYGKNVRIPEAIPDFAMEQPADLKKTLEENPSLDHAVARKYARSLVGATEDNDISPTDVDKAFVGWNPNEQGRAEKGAIQKDRVNNMNDLYASTSALFNAPRIAGDKIPPGKEPESKIPVPAVPEVAAAAVKETAKEEDPLKAYLKKILGDSSARADELRQTPKDTDLSGLLSFADYISGSNLRKGYEAPERWKTSQVLAQKQDEQALGAAKALADNKSLKEIALADKQESEKGKLIQLYQKRFDDQSDKTKSARNMAKMVSGFIQTGDPSLARAIPDVVGSLVPRMMREVGNLAQNERKLVGYGKSAEDVLNRWMGLLTEGKLPSSEKNTLLKLAQFTQKSHERDLLEMADSVATQGVAGSKKYGIPKEEFVQSFGLPFARETEETQAAAKKDKIKELLGE